MSITFQFSITRNKNASIVHSIGTPRNNMCTSFYVPKYTWKKMSNMNEIDEGSAAFVFDSIILKV